jgi:hypothetical protein
MISFFSLESLFVHKDIKKIEMKKNHHTIHKNLNVSYDDFGETFGKSRRNLHWDEIDEVLSQFLGDFRPTTHNIADIGCGNGRLI